MATRKGVRILRAFDPFSFKSTQSGARKSVQSGQVISRSKQEVRPPAPRVTTRRKVRRLHVNDPYNQNSVSGPLATGATVARFSPEADQFTNSSNPAFDPSKSPTRVVEVGMRKQLSNQTPGKASRGHGNVIVRTLFNATGGKRLRRL